MSIDRKMIGVKDLVYIISVVFSVSGMYYTLDNRISSLEENQTGLKQMVKENAKLTKTIYLGLIASGAIKPPSQ